METKEYIKQAYEKHDQLINIVADRMAFKYNKQAHEVIFIEYYQKRNGQWHDSMWKKYVKYNAVILGNEQIQYIFKKETLLKLLRYKQVKEYRGGKVKGITLLADEAKRFADLVLE